MNLGESKYKVGQVVLVNNCGEDIYTIIAVLVIKLGDDSTRFHAYDLKTSGDKPYIKAMDADLTLYVDIDIEQLRLI